MKEKSHKIRKILIGLKKYAFYFNVVKNREKKTVMLALPIE